MSTTDTTQPLAEKAQHPISADERIGHRGPLQKLLITPEIGALTGGILVWLLFWSVGDQFGTAAGFGNTLDVAVPNGIMAVAVALLMIGGEFDLSSGAITGASAMMVALMTRFFMGSGTNIYLALLVSLIACVALGWLNGTLVNRTGLPSFIVTLGAFFVLKGAKLVFAKRLANKVQVDVFQSTTAKGPSGFKALRSVFAGEVKQKPFGSRDDIVIVLLAVAGLLVIVGLLELSLRKRASINRTGVAVGVAGAAGIAVGFALLLKTDGVGQNVVWGAVALVGIVLLVVGIAQARYASRPLGQRTVPTALVQRAGFGIGLFVLSMIFTFWIDRHEKKVILSFLPSWLRVLTAVAGGVLGGAIAVRALLPALRARFGAGSAVRMALVAVGGAVVLGTTVQIMLQLMTMRALRAVLVVGLLTLALLVVLGARARGSRTSPFTTLLCGGLASAMLLVFALVVRSTSNAVRFRVGLMTALLMAAAALLANTLVEALSTKRSEPDTKADKLGRNIAAGGVVIGIGALAFRVLFTNQTFYKWVLWWVVITAIGTIVLNKTRIGNWIYSVGGNKDAARAIGVPVNRVKVGLFVAVSTAGWLVGSLQLLRYKTVTAGQGDGQEFIFIIAAVVGGNLLTGGYGSVIGASIGALILAMTTTGVPFARWNSDGQFIFQGVLLLGAVLVNNFIRRKAQESR